MRTPRWTRLLVLTGLLSGPAEATEPRTGPDASGGASVPRQEDSVPRQEGAVLRLDTSPGAPDFLSLVQARPVSPGRVVLEGEALSGDGAVQLGEVLTGLPGLDTVRRAAGSTEPVLRGLGGERVRTQLGILPLYGACPSGMDPPVTYLAPSLARSVEVTFGPGAEPRGGGASGGEIVVEPGLADVRPTATTLARSLSGRYRSAGQGVAGIATVRATVPGLELAASLDGLRTGDYAAADGTEVPAGQQRFAGSALAGWWPTANQRTWLLVSRVRELDTDFPSLPMDLDRSGAWLLTGGWHLQREAGVLRRVELQLGGFVADHQMSNTDKPNRPQLEAEAVTESRSGAAGVRLELRPTPGTELALGGDAALLGRDARRSRWLPKTGQTFEDHLWPDARQLDLGLHGRLTRLLGTNVRLELGLRGDLVRSEAAAADERAAGGPTLRQQWASYYGAEAAEQVDRQEWLGGGWAQLRWGASSGLAAHLRGGLAQRAAGIGERFYAFAPSPGGYQVGDPALAPERSWGGELGADWQRSWLEASTRLFATRVQDFILPTRIDRRDVNGDGALDDVRGFVNVDAALLGGELALTLRPTGWLTLPATLAVVRGENETDGRPLPLIPPLTATAAVRVESPAGGVHHGWVEIGGRWGGAQERIDAAYPEDSTPSFLALRAEVGATLGGRLRARLAVENLLDATYHEHLTREALLPVGDLAAGDEIPVPGRSLELLLQAAF